MIQDDMPSLKESANKLRCLVRFQLTRQWAQCSMDSWYGLPNYPLFNKEDGNRSRIEFLYGDTLNAQGLVYGSDYTAVFDDKEWWVTLTFKDHNKALMFKLAAQLDDRGLW